MKKIIFILVSVLISSTATRAVNRTWVGTNNQWLVTNFSPSTGTLSSADNITIPTVTAPFVYPVLSASKTCNDLTFTGNGRITCPSGKQITITGNLTNSTSGPGVF